MWGNNTLFLPKIFVMTLGIFLSVPVFAVNSVPISSQYGLVQNVPGYASGGLWNHDLTYNQRMPQAVYAQGPDLGTGDCQQIVAAAIAKYCAENNRCRGTNLMDVKPNITILLAGLPNHNYATACGGFIDSEYKNYMENYSDVMQVQRSVPFPTAIGGTTVGNNSNGTKPVESQWQQDVRSRENELNMLQKQNGAGGEHLSAATFPTTYSDLSFTERMENQAKGYEPYKDKKAYVLTKGIDEKDLENLKKNKEGNAKKQNEQSEKQNNDSGAGLSDKKRRISEKFIKTLEGGN